MERPYLIWDWNGTLLDDVGAAVGAVNRMLAARSLPPITREFYRAHFGFPVRPFYAKAGFDLEHEDWDGICVEYHSAIAEESDQHLRQDAGAALALARDTCAGQSILSALREDLLRRDVAAAGIASMFDAVYGVDNLDGATKLSRGHDLIRRLGLEDGAHGLYFIGDTLHDAEVAKALGARCILVGCGHQAAERLAAAGCPVVASPTEAVRLIAQR